MWGLRTQGLLLKEEEAGVDQLEEFGQVVELLKLANFLAISDVCTYVVQNNQLVRPATVVVADGVEKTVTGDGGDELLSEERQEYAADGSKVKVVDLEQEVELEGLTPAHQLATAKDDNVVCDEEGRAALEGRERSLALHEAEILGLVASDGLECLLEDRPQLDAEGAV